MMPSLYPLLWLILSVILGVIEAVTIDLVAIWFALGALVAVIPAMFKLSLAVQVVVFLAVSIASLIIFKPFVKNMLKVRKVSTNADSIIGMMGTVTEEIIPTAEKGRVHVNGLDWKAVSDDGVPIEAGSQVIIKAISGVTVTVERI